MAVRALIIAIENYPLSEGGGMAKHLRGTLQGGLEFRDWLLAKCKQEGQQHTQVIFCSEPVHPGCSGASRDEIVIALESLRQHGQGSTEELFFFFSGHGFSFAEGINSPRADTIVCSDFKNSKLSGPCCLKLDEIIYWLRGNLGPGRHYYFVDACRNQLDPRQIRVSAQLQMDAQSSAEASTFVLQSTVDGAVAAVGGPFQSALLAGLRGKGKAKAWNSKVKDAMFVRYDSLRNYLKTSLQNQPITSRVEGTEGDSDAVLATLRPVPNSKCIIEISNAAAKLKGEIVYTRGRSVAETRKVLVNKKTELDLEPDEYAIAVRLNSGVVEPSEPVEIDLYEDQSLTFKKLPGRMAAPEASSQPMEVALKVTVPNLATVELLNLNSGARRSVKSSRRMKVPYGRYLATLQNNKGQIFRRQEIDLKGSEAILDLTEWGKSPPHLAIANRLPHGKDGVVFSESLGILSDTDLDLWLALLGGGRIVGASHEKLSQFPLHDFGNEQAGAAAVYVLAGFEKIDTKLKVGLSTNNNPVWVDAVQPPAMRGIREAFLPTQGGPMLASFLVGAGPAYTVASFAMPNRVTLVTLTTNDDGDVRIGQFLLPIAHLKRKLPPTVRQRLANRNQLRDILRLAKANRAFRKRRDLLGAIAEDELDELLYLKWLDPIGCCIAAYEFVRRGKQESAGIRQVVKNLDRFFLNLPDTIALAKLSGRRVLHDPNGTPIFLDGLRAFPDYKKLPLPAGHLDFTSPWTAWRAAVVLP